MADSMCGPSNALQNLSKHTSTDHSLQRDRLRHQQGSPSSLGQFRSATPHSSSTADAEFSRFSGQPPPSLLHHPADPLLRTGTPVLSNRLPVHDNWASDFQNLEISSSPLPHHPSQQALRPTKSAFFPQQQSVSAQQWRQEFSASPVLQQQQQSSTLMGGMAGYGMTNYSTFSPMYQSSTAPMVGTQSSVAAQQDDFQFDESAFESAFAMAAQDLAVASVSAEPVMTEEPMIVEEEPTVEEKEEEKRRNDADDLARTAGQLLESVKGDTSEKFQKSSFMALMKKLRDREAMIEGDNIVEKGQQ